MTAKRKTAPKNQVQNVETLTGSSPPSGEAPKFEPLAMATSSPDAELIALGMFYLERYSARDAAFERESELNAVYEAARPLEPDAIRFNEADELLRDKKEWENRIIDKNYYVSFEIDSLRNKKREKIVIILTRDGIRSESVIDEEAQTRAEALIAAFDAWDAECKRIEEETGAAEAERVADALTVEVDKLAEKIWSMPAHTLAGLAIKASVVRDLVFACNSDPIVRSLCGQFAKIVGSNVGLMSSIAAQTERAAA